MSVTGFADVDFSTDWNQETSITFLLKKCLLLYSEQYSNNWPTLSLIDMTRNNRFSPFVSTPPWDRRPASQTNICLISTFWWANALPYSLGPLSRVHYSFAAHYLITWLFARVLHDWSVKLTLMRTGQVRVQKSFCRVSPLEDILIQLFWRQVLAKFQRLR